ncbi:hypothetical protein, partial [Staphylococcus lugdunensis]
GICCMNEYNKKDEDLDDINAEIEKELNEYDPEHDTKKVKKEYLTMKFVFTLILVLMLASGIIKMFI